MENPLPEIKATASRLRALAHQKHLTAAALERALALSGTLPTPSRWGQAINYALLVLGVAFTLSGIFFFFAYNWATLPRLFKFGLIEVAILLAVGLAAYWGLQKLAGRAMLLAAAFLVGVLQAVYGQVYQTGADAYQLFLGWAVFITGWVIISAHAPLWFLWLVLLNISLVTYGTQVLAPGAGMYVALLGLNAIGLLSWEYARHRGVPWLTARWPIRLIACAAFVFAVIPTLQFIFFDFLATNGPPPDLWRLLAPVFYAGFVGLVLFLYMRKFNDLFILTLAAFSLVVVITAGLSRIVFLNASGFGPVALAALCVGGAIIGQMAVAFYLLRRIMQAKEQAQ